MNIIKPIYEFLLWDNCNNNCKFCFQRINSNIIDVKTKKTRIYSVLNYLNSDSFVKKSHILLVGGEIFDDCRIYNELQYLIYEIIKMMSDNEIDILYINTNLIYKKINLDFVISLLEQFSKNNLLNRVHFTTSYDIEGRFLSEETKNIFFNSLKKISDVKDINLITNIIMTNKFCDCILSNQFDIFDFSKKYKTYINLIPYIILSEKLAPSRQKIFKTIQKLWSIDHIYVQNLYNDLNLKQPRKIINFDQNGNVSYHECGNSECGHSINFKKYSINNTCFVCDFEKIISYLQISN